MCIPPEYWEPDCAIQELAGAPYDVVVVLIYERLLQAIPMTTQTTTRTITPPTAPPTVPP